MIYYGSVGRINLRVSDGVLSKKGPRHESHGKAALRVANAGEGRLAGAGRRATGPLGLSGGAFSPQAGSASRATASSNRYRLSKKLLKSGL
jgi:hypothetical protein